MALERALEFRQERRRKGGSGAARGILGARARRDGGGGAEGAGHGVCRAGEAEFFFIGCGRKGEGEREEVIQYYFIINAQLNKNSKYTQFQRRQAARKLAMIWFFFS